MAEEVFAKLGRDDVTKATGLTVAEANNLHQTIFLQAFRATTPEQVAPHLSVGG